MTTREEINRIAAEIENLRGEYDAEYVWGVRFDAPGLEVGHTFDASRVWVDGEPTDEYLPGTCVVPSTHLHKRCVLDYPGTAYIVCGNLAAYGEDCGEVILTDCEVMAL